MRILAFAILAIGTVSIRPAAAQMYDPAYPVCLHVWSRGANYYECSYTSLPQCNASASGRAADTSSILILRAHECLRDDLIAVSTKIVSRPSTEIEGFPRSRNIAKLNEPFLYQLKGTPAESARLDELGARP